MNKFNKKNKIKILIGIAIIIFLGIYFVYSKTDENEVFSFEDGIEKNKDENNKNENNLIDNKIEEKNKIIIHISGSIVNEGILELDENSRISDAIEKSGGLTEGADMSEINLAFVLSDGMKVYIPNIKDKEIENKNEDKTNLYIKKESGVSTIVDNLNNDKNSIKNMKININTANLNELDMLPGIGDSTAQKIIDYRNENGKFNSIEDIKNIKGIGESKFEKIKDYIVVK